ncbi:MAG: GNAT family N-acetyltransferase [Planctomycetaceae bacterium]|jgi:CelD/BcsL family acetyltransferase involved in cellulose biosynthesis|nr:GNAT family N-acetyltransferase [Planctomycetaceae bacterium]
MRTRLICSEDELITLKDFWDVLVCCNPETDLPFFSWDWFYHSWIHFGKPNGQELAVVAVEDEDQLVGLLPLIRRSCKSFGIPYRVLRFCNTGMTPRNTIYVDTRKNQDAILQSAWNYLFENRSRWDMLEFGNVPDTAPLHRFILDGQHTAKYALIQNQGLISPFLKLTGSVDDYLATLDKKVRYNIKRYIKLFETNEKNHEVRLFQSPDETEYALQLAMEVKGASWKGTADNSRYFQFFRDVLPELFAKKEAIILAVFLDKTPIGASFRLKRNGIYYGFGTDYKQEYKEHSPGVLMLYYLLQHIAQSDGYAFDFCGGDYNYKKQYTDVVHCHSTFQIFHSGLKSRFLYSSKTFWLPLLRKVLHKEQPKDFIAKAKHY